MKNFISEEKMVEHPGKLLAEYLDQEWWTQKAFALHIGKKISEINELIKGKRNITIAWDVIFSQVFQTPQKFWILKQIDYDYQQVLDKSPIKTIPKNPKIKQGLGGANEKNVEANQEKKSEFIAPAEVPEEFLITKVFESF